MKRLLIGLLALGTISAFASPKDEYCKIVQDANFVEIYRLGYLAAKQTDYSETEKILKEMAKVEEISVITAKYCEKKH